MQTAPMGSDVGEPRVAVCPAFFKEKKQLHRSLIVLTYLHLIHRLRRRDIALGTVARHRLAGTGTLRARLIRSAASLKVSQKRKFRGGVVSAFNPQIRRSKGKRSVGFSFVHAFAYFKLDHVVGQRSTSIAPCR